ncbi:MAG: site-specific integrase [Acidimicrobiales bacterium]
MAHIETRGPGRWRARFRDRDGRELSRTFARRTDAVRFLALAEADKAHGAWIDPAAGRTPFGVYARAWQQAQVHRGTTADQVASNLRNHILPAFENRPLAAVRPSEVQAWVRGRAEELAPSTVEVVYRYLAAIFGAAVRDRMIARSPCVGIRLPRVATAEVRPATTDDVLAIAYAVPPRYRALVLLTAGTGLRQGAAFGVVLPNLDIDAGDVRVDRQVVLRAGHPPVLAPPKTDASFRTIPLPTGVAAVVHSHLAAFLATTRPEHGPLVFTTPAGEPFRRNRFGDVWRAAVRRSAARPDLTFHFAALLRLAAHPPRRVGEGRPAPPRPQDGPGDARHLRPPLARLGRPDPRRRRRRAVPGGRSGRHRWRPERPGRARRRPRLPRNPAAWPRPGRLRRRHNRRSEGLVTVSRPVSGGVTKGLSTGDRSSRK